MGVGKRLRSSTLALGRGQVFDSQNPYGGSQLSVIPVLGDPTGTHLIHNIHAGKTFIHIK